MCVCIYITRSKARERQRSAERLEMMGSSNSNSSYIAIVKTLSFLTLLLAGRALGQQFQNEKCPFDFILHLGDGFFDAGNAVRILPYGPYLPPKGLPYGETWPGKPAGRWCDGKLDPDHIAGDLGFNGIVPYLGGHFPPGRAILFGVALSPVLDRSFFDARNIKIPAFAAPLSVQMSWLKQYLRHVASTREEIANVLSTTLFFFGDTSSNDLAFPLLQGQSIEQVQSYIPYVIEAVVNAAREMVWMGATRLLFPGGFPLGCFPFIKTQYPSNNTADYDALGCLKDINNLIVLKNNALQQAINALQQEFPNIWFQYADFYGLLTRIMNEANITGITNISQACCGIGGAYNFNSSRFCGSPGVPVCKDPTQYLFWDGIHLTDKGNSRTSALIRPLINVVLNCTAPPNTTTLLSYSFAKQTLQDFSQPLLKSSI